MDFLLDTVTIIRHFSSTGIIASKAKQILNNDKNNFYLSIISLMEIMYLAEKARIELNLNETLALINQTDNYIIGDLTPEILLEAQNIRFYELHDRLILATAIYLNVPIVSSDAKFKEIKNISVIWK